MTTSEATARLQAANIAATKTRVSYAILAGRVRRPPQDGAGNFQFGKRHLEELAAYFRAPHKRGKRPMRQGAEQ